MLILAIITHFMLPYPSLFGSLVTNLTRAIVAAVYLLPYPSLFGSLVTLTMVKTLYQKMVAIPFSFRVTCNRHFFRLDRLKTYLTEPRFCQIAHGSFSEVWYLKKFGLHINLTLRSKTGFCFDVFFSQWISIGILTYKDLQNPSNGA